MKRTILITVIFGLISSLSTYFLFYSMEGFRKEIKESKTAILDVKEQVSTIENNYRNQIQYWVKKNSDLNIKIQKTDFALNESKQKEKSLQGKIQWLISESKVLKDTSAIVSNCDSLKDKVSEYFSEAAVKDSLCDEEITQLKVVIQNKDSAFAVCERGFFAMRSTIDFSLAQQTALTEKLNQADKQLKRQSRNSKFLAGGLMFLSGVTTILLLQK